MKKDDPAYKKLMSDIARIKKSYGAGERPRLSKADQEKVRISRQEVIQSRKAAIVTGVGKLLDGTSSLEEFLRETAELNDSDLDNKKIDDLMQLVIDTYVLPENKQKDILVKIRYIIDGLKL